MKPNSGIYSAIFQINKSPKIGVALASKIQSLSRRYMAGWVMHKHKYHFSCVKFLSLFWKTFFCSKYMDGATPIKDFIWTMQYHREFDCDPLHGRIINLNANIVPLIFHSGLGELG